MRGVCTCLSGRIFHIKKPSRETTARQVHCRVLGPDVADRGHNFDVDPSGRGEQHPQDLVDPRAHVAGTASSESLSEAFPILGLDRGVVGDGIEVERT